METVGAWRSLVAHTLGVRVVAGSNPAAPTNAKLSQLRNSQSPQLTSGVKRSSVHWQAFASLYSNFARWCITMTASDIELVRFTSPAACESWLRLLT